MKRPARGDNPLLAKHRKTNVYWGFSYSTTSQLAAVCVNESGTCVNDWHKSDTGLFLPRSRSWGWGR